MGGKGSGGNHGAHGVPYEKNPVKQAGNPFDIDPDANSRSIAMSKWLFGLETPDYSSETALQERFFEYLEMCSRLGMKPLVMTCAQAFGMNRDAFTRIAKGDKAYRNWNNGALTPESTLVISKAYESLSGIWEGLISEEKGNPVKWIFLGKNYYGMRDQTEHIQVRADVTPQLTSTEELSEKYSKLVGKPSQDALPGEIISVEDA